MASFSLSPETALSSVAIKVKDFDRMLSFYEQVVGFDILREENDMAILGNKEDKQKLLGIISTPDGKGEANNHSGLNHTSFVFPTRNDLARFMKHLIALNYPIEGESDHGYCESIYINDPESNRLEFSWDRPQSEWPLTNGFVKGVTKELNIQSFLSQVTGDYTGIPKGTKLGHVHLSVSDREDSHDFYRNHLGFMVRDHDFSSVEFLSVSDYHHQIAFNEWIPSTDHCMLKEDELGVDHITFTLPSMDDLMALKENLDELEYEFYFNKGKQIIGVNDPSGIELWFLVAK